MLSTSKFSMMNPTFLLNFYFLKTSLGKIIYSENSNAAFFCLVQDVAENVFFGW